MELTHIKAIYTPDDCSAGAPQEAVEAVKAGQDVAEPESVEIVALTSDNGYPIEAVFIDHDGNLRRGFLRQFSYCVFVTP